MKKFAVLFISCVALAQMGFGQATVTNLASSEGDDLLGMINELHLARVSMAYRATVLDSMLKEANFYSERLRLPTPHPIQPLDLCEIRVFDPWHSAIRETNAPYLPDTVFKTRIFDAGISRNERAHSLKIAASGVIGTTNCFFSFKNGILWNLHRQNDKGLEFHPPLDKPVIINEAEAKQLAAHYLEAISVDISALEKRFQVKVWQDHYFTGTSNEIVAHFFNIQWGAGDSPPVIVVIDGTTKELLGIRINDASVCQRSLLIVTNAVELSNVPEPSINNLERQPQASNSMPAIPAIGIQEMKRE